MRVFMVRLSQLNPSGADAISFWQICLVILGCFAHNGSAEAVCPDGGGVFGLLAPAAGNEIATTSEFRFWNPILPENIFTLESPGLDTVSAVLDDDSDFVLQATTELMPGVSYSLYHTFADCFDCREKVDEFQVAVSDDSRAPPTPNILSIEYGRSVSDESCNGNFGNQDQLIDIQLERPESDSEGLRPIIRLRWDDPELEIGRILTHADPTAETRDGFGAVMALPMESIPAEIEIEVYFVNLAGESGPPATQLLSLGQLPLSCAHSTIVQNCGSMDRWAAKAAILLFAVLLLRRSRVKVRN
jgi:hypothetical protein